MRPDETLKQFEFRIWRENFDAALYHAQRMDETARPVGDHINYATLYADRATAAIMTAHKRIGSAG